MRFRVIVTVKSLFLLTVALSCSLPDRGWAYSESGPELIAPDTVLMSPTVDPAPRPEGDLQSQKTDSITDRTTTTLVDQAANAVPPPSHDGWVTKGSRPQTRNAQAGVGSSTGSSFAPPPASLPGTQVTPQTSMPTQRNPSQGAVLPYPYGTPAPVPDYLGYPQSSQNSPILRQVIPGERATNRSGGVLASVGRWWDSLWGKRPMDPVPTTSFGSGSSPGGWTTGISPNPARTTPWTTTRPVTPGAGASPGSPATSIVQPYATPYALPPRSSEGSPVLSLPLTAHPSQPATGGSYPPSPTASPLSSSGMTGPAASTVRSQSANGQNASSPGSSDASIYGGWSATPSVTGSDTLNRSMTTSTLPPNPHYPSGFGTAMPFPSGNQPHAALWNGGVPSARPEKATPSLIDRVRSWWADVTAPKGIQGRQALLPPESGTGRLLGAGFRGRPTPVPSTDPFSNYGIGTGAVVSVPAPGNGVTSQSPAVLPPSAPQLPLRQAW